MAQIDPTTVNVDELIQRIQAVRRGELPSDAVSIDELRAALEAQRQRFSTSAKAAESTVKAKGSSTRRSIVVPTFDL